MLLPSNIGHSRWISAMEIYLVLTSLRYVPLWVDLIIMLFFFCTRYRQKLKTEKVQTRSIEVWDFDSIETLKGCFEVTDWDLFLNGCGNDDDMLNFHVYSVIPVKSVKRYPNINNKPWVTKDLKHCLNLKKNSFYFF